MIFAEDYMREDIVRIGSESELKNMLGILS